MSFAPCMMTSATDEWTTPQALFDALDLEFRFTLDACASGENAKCARFFSREQNGLIQDWSGHTVFMNPPYGREIGKWMRKANEASIAGSTVVCLIPARTCSGWWHDFAQIHEVRFIRGRIKFGGQKWNAPFPSAIVVMKPAQPLSGRVARAAKYL